MVHLEVKKTSSKIVAGFQSIFRPPTTPLVSNSTWLDFFHHFWRENEASSPAHFVSYSTSISRCSFLIISPRKPCLLFALRPLIFQDSIFMRIVRVEVEGNCLRSDVSDLILQEIYRHLECVNVLVSYLFFSHILWVWVDPLRYPFVLWDSHWLGLILTPMIWERLYGICGDDLLVWCTVAACGKLVPDAPCQYLIAPNILDICLVLPFLIQV
jgi:hypothetical protein